jgi:hypothetical protein
MTSGYLAAVLTTETVGSKTLFLPNVTTPGHHQIEEKCESCHTPFSGVTNEACLACHGTELTAADDSHPRSKFTDPRNAELAMRLDATRCVTCHREHDPEVTRPMGVTLPDDYCYTCHAEVGTERPSHAGMAFATCATAGCHNYHDNTALYEDFLAAHADDPALRPTGRVRSRSLRDALRARTGAPVPSQPRMAADAPPAVTGPLAPSRVAEWEAAAHARAGVNCSGCHADAAGAWVNRPGERACASCHEGEVQGFFGGRHGMRPASGLAPMRPAVARLPMKADAHEREVSCSSCHGAHDFDTRRAAVDACLGCHDDGHSRAYVGSPHHALHLREQQLTVPDGSGVTCATCHLPRTARRINGVDVVIVEHNQNANLRPVEKMTRTVCLDCHGLGFSLDALADGGLIEANFTGKPLRSVAGIEMAKTRMGRTAQRR